MDDCVRERLGKRPERSGKGAGEWYSGQEVSRYSEENAKRQRELALQALRLLGYQMHKTAWDAKEKEGGSARGVDCGLGGHECAHSTDVMVDLGCGSGLSLAAVREASKHMAVRRRPLVVVGCDIAGDMVQEAARRLGRTGQPAVGLLRSDFSQGLPFRDAVFSYGVSVSAIQWLTTEKGRISFFSSLWRVLCDGGRAALQFYPSGPQDAEEMLQIALKGERHCFTGDLVMEMPHSAPQRKWYLCLRKVSCKACIEGTCEDGGCGDRDMRLSVASLPQCELALPYRACCALSWREIVTKNGQRDCGDIASLTVTLARAKKLSPYYQLHRQHVQRSHALVRLHSALEEVPPPRKLQRTKECDEQLDSGTNRAQGRRRKRAGSSKSLSNDISPEDATDVDIRLARRLVDVAGGAASFAELQKSFRAVLGVLHSVDAPEPKEKV